MDPVRKGPVGGPQGRRVGLMGEDLGPAFAKIHQRIQEFPVPPTSIWAFNPPRSRAQEELREYVGDDGLSRAGSFGTGRFLPASPGQEASDKASVFNPELAAALVAAYTCAGEWVIDPFAGGGTRAIIAATAGRRYFGVDIRGDEVERVNARLAALGFLDESDVFVVQGDAAMFDWHGPAGIPDGVKADALITCPPYWNLEVYSEDPRDLSTARSYSAFLAGLARVVKRARHAVRDGGFIVWVVGEFRDPKTNEILPFPADVVRLHQQAGCWWYDHVIYSPNNQQATRRAGTFDRTRKVVRVHEDVLVFRVGGRG